MLSEPRLGGRLIFMIAQPPERGEQYELNVRQLVRLQYCADPSLPGQRDAPQQQAGALSRFLEMRVGTRRYDERSLARATSDTMVCGKSAVIIGPTCRA
jgi:hypothetical protein